MERLSHNKYDVKTSEIIAPPHLKSYSPAPISCVGYPSAT